MFRRSPPFGKHQPRQRPGLQPPLPARKGCSRRSSRAPGQPSRAVSRRIVMASPVLRGYCLLLVMKGEDLNRDRCRKVIRVLIGLSICLLSGFAFTKTSHPVPAAIFGVGLVTLGAILVGYQFVAPVVRPLTTLLGLEQYSPSRHDKPEYNLRIGRNFLEAKYYPRAYEHALRMIEHYPDRTEAFEIAYQAVKEGQLGEEALDRIEALARRGRQ